MKMTKLDIDREVAVLQNMTTNELVEHYAQVFGEGTRTRHKPYLLRRIAWRVQAIAEGDLSVRARRRAAELVNGADVLKTPPKTMPLRAQTGPTMPARPIPGCRQGDHPHARSPNLTTPEQP